MKSPEKIKADRLARKQIQETLAAARWRAQRDADQCIAYMAASRRMWESQSRMVDALYASVEKEPSHKIQYWYNRMKFWRKS